MKLRLNEIQTHINSTKQSSSLPAEIKLNKEKNLD